MSVDLGFALLAGLLGVVMARTSLCSVASLQRLVIEGRLDGVLRLVMVTSAAGTMLVALALWWPGQIWLPRDRPLTLTLLAGAVLLGIGSVVNGACYLGSVLYLGRGNSNFVFTLVGLVIAFRFSRLAMPMQMSGEFRQAMGLWSSAALGAFAVALAASLWLALRASGSDRGGIVETRREARRSARGAAFAALGVGVVAGLIYARHPDWNYGSVLESLAHAGERPLRLPGEAAALMLFSGATLGAALTQRWRFQGLQFSRALRCLAGGALMGWGASLIPGGHDLLLLWAIPGITGYGLAAYLVMAATVSMLLVLGQRVLARGAARSE